VPVERGDEGEMETAGGEHLAGEERADRVGNSVVDVEEIERVELGDLWPCRWRGRDRRVGVRRGG